MAPALRFCAGSTPVPTHINHGKFGNDSTFYVRRCPISATAQTSSLAPSHAFIGGGFWLSPIAVPGGSIAPLPMTAAGLSSCPRPVTAPSA